MLIDLCAAARLTVGMKGFASLGLAFAAVLLAGCADPNSGPAPAPPAGIITPDNSLAGKVVSYNSIGRFVVLNFPSRRMPGLSQQLFLYRSGFKVAEIRVTGPQNDDNTVADLISGDAQVGDEVRDQ